MKTGRTPTAAVFALAVAGALAAGCQDRAGPTTSDPAGTADPPPDSQAFTDAQYDRVRAGLAGINVGQVLIHRTHPTGSFLSAMPPTMVLSADRREIIAKVTGRWAGGVTGAEYETTFTIEITKARTRLTVERDTAVFQIDPEHLRLAELDVTNLVRPLL